MLGAPPGPAWAAGELTGIRLGTQEGYSRLVFLFSAPVKSYDITRPDADEIHVIFDAGGVTKQGSYPLSDSHIQGVAVYLLDGRVQVRVKTTMTKFSFRHFPTPDKKAVILDLKADDFVDRSTRSAPGVTGISLNVPTIEQVAKDLDTAIAKTPPRGTGEEMFRQGLDELLADNYLRAAAVFERLRVAFPQSSYLEPALYLLGECYLIAYDKDLKPHFKRLTDILREAATAYPQSPLAPRGLYLLAQAYMSLRYYSEAAGYYSLLIKDFPGTDYAMLAHLKLGDAYLNMGQPDKARQPLSFILSLRPTGMDYLVSYFHLGRTYFSKALYGEAIEVFKAVLKTNPEFYVQYPEILYYLGESYFHVKKYELSRTFLYHEVNIFPDFKARDMAMARIGDTYKEQGRNNEAIKIYKITQEMFPDSTGALISQVRLAEFGALKSVFRPDTIFVELEEGTRVATLKIYEEIVATHKDSPLVELAMFKIGLAAYWQKDYSRAIRVFTDTIKKFPEGSVVEDVRFVLGKAILAQARELFQQRDYLELIGFFNREKVWIPERNIADVRLYAALAHNRLDLPREAAELFLADIKVPDGNDQRLAGLGEAYQKLGEYDKATRYYQEFLDKYPRHPRRDIAFRALANISQAQGDLKKAIDYLVKAQQANRSYEKNGQFQAELGRLYLDTGQYAAAVRALDLAASALKGQENQQEELFLVSAQLSRALARAGQEAQALATLEGISAQNMDKPVPGALYLMAKTYEDLGQKEKALSLFNEIIKTNDPFWKPMVEQELMTKQVNQEIQEEIDKVSDLLKKAREDS